MAVQKLITYNNLNTDKQIEVTKSSIKLNVFETLGNYLIHKDITRHNFFQKQGTSCTKTRSEVRGGGRKPWKQKGTGKARVGSIRSPLWRGGGVIFGPKPKFLKFKINKKERKLSLQTLLYNHRNNISIIPDNIFLNINKTKDLILILKFLKLPISEKILIVVNKKPKNLILSIRNLSNIDLILASNLNTLEILKAKQVIITSSALISLKETYCD